MAHESKWEVEGEKASAKIVASCSCGAAKTYTPGATLSPNAAIEDAKNFTLEHSDGRKEKISRHIWEKFREKKIDLSAY